MRRRFWVKKKWQISTKPTAFVHWHPFPVANILLFCSTASVVHLVTTVWRFTEDLWTGHARIRKIIVSSGCHITCWKNKELEADISNLFSVICVLCSRYWNSAAHRIHNNYNRITRFWPTITTKNFFFFDFCKTVGYDKLLFRLTATCNY